jgi:predicted ATP-grasp superfamily ATP-dependent carboligase
VFVYEYLTAHALGRGPADPHHGMYREGRAMRDALAADFLRLGGVEVITVPDDEAPGDRPRFEAASRSADWTCVIAPESGGILTDLTDAVGRCGGRLLGPTPATVRLTSDKLALSHRWRARGVPTPATTDREPTGCEAFPLVWKPRDGAGSAATFLLDSALDVRRAKALLAAGGGTGPMILQEYVTGTAASVAFLCGPAGTVPLAPCRQHLSDDGRFTYRGGELPIPPDLAERAIRLASRAVEGVPGLLGYVGVDLVLGEAADGSRDHAIEINPRLTTSYVGLRKLALFDIAEAMLRVAAGDDPGPLTWKTGRVRFAADGTITG